MTDQLRWGIIGPGAIALDFLAGLEQSRTGKLKAIVQTGEKRSALAADIMPTARSIDAVGFCGVNVAEASATLLAIPATSALSSRSARSGRVHWV